MRVTTEIKNYIRVEVYAKAKPRLDELEGKRNAIVKKYMDRYEQFVEATKCEVNALNKKIAAIAKRLGLTERGKDCEFVLTNINTNYFDEVHTSYYRDGDYYDHNDEIAAADNALSKLKSDIEHQIAGVVFKLETGAKRGEIEELLAAIKF